MKVIKVTGEIGSGKSTFIFEQGAKFVAGIQGISFYEKDGIIYIESNQEIEFSNINIEKK